MQSISRDQILSASSIYNTKCESFGTVKKCQSGAKLGVLKELKGKCSIDFDIALKVGVAFECERV